jgi:competence protein ComEC
VAGHGLNPGSGSGPGGGPRHEARGGGKAASWAAVARRAALEELAVGRGRLFLFAPVALGAGIGFWFALPVEPDLAAYLVIALATLGCAALGWCGPEGLRPVSMAACLIGTGFCLAGLRAHQLAAPVLDFRYYGPIEGRVVTIDRSLSDRLRLTLDSVVLERVEPARTPARVRVSLHGDQALTPEAGMIVILTGHLSPPEGPVEPGGFDFRRFAWFKQLGAVGYTRSPALVLAPAQPEGLDIAITRLRLSIAAAVRARIPGEAGAFSAAILTGDRSGVARQTLEDLRASNLAHLLAISGLHMGLLTGIVFAALRYGMALIPPLALRLPVRKIAALGALAVAAFYLALSGGNVATQRAFVMVSVMLAAVLVDRRAISLRSVAIAAMLILMLRPESLIEAGFQMSFTATAALVAAFTALPRLPERWRGPHWLRPALAVVLSSAVAGAATAPIAAAHFNRIADYGLMANLASVPVMGSVVMPAAVAAAVLSLIGLAAPAFWVMGQGTRWILHVASTVAGWENSITAVPAPPAAVLPLLALGGLWLLIWPGRLRPAGAVLMLAGFALWSGAERPALLIAPSGAMAGLMTGEGRVLTKPRGDGFVSRSWLENDGDLAPPEEAATRAGMDGARPARHFLLGQTPGVHLFGKGALDALPEACRPGHLVILDTPAPAAPRDCFLIDQAYLDASGAVAVRPGPKGALILRGAYEAAGSRLWTRN